MWEKPFHNLISFLTPPQNPCHLALLRQEVSPQKPITQSYQLLPSLAINSLGLDASPDPLGGSREGGGLSPGPRMWARLEVQGMG